VTTSSTNNKSDLLALARGNIAKNWVAETGWQYNTDLQRTERFNMTTRYQPQAGKVVNVTYRENSDNLRQAELSSQWQINAEWGFVGRLSRSLIDNRNLETLGGLEYRDPCWSLRLVAHRFATTSTTANTSLFLQFELSGLSRSSAPLDVLRRNITGYKQLDPRAPNPVEYNMPGIF
jgi:LPS-assembly protein